MMISLGTGIVTEAFPPEERGKALGIIGAIVSIGIIL
jgi:MFS family permease